MDQPDQTRRIEDIQSHCAVLTPKEFVKGKFGSMWQLHHLPIQKTFNSERPTEIPECDVFVCESRVPGVSFAKGEPSSLFMKPTEKVRFGTIAFDPPVDQQFINRWRFQCEDENYDPSNSGIPMHIESAKPARKFKVCLAHAFWQTSAAYRMRTTAGVRNYGLQGAELHQQRAPPQVFEAATRAFARSV